MRGEVRVGLIAMGIAIAAGACAVGTNGGDDDNNTNDGGMTNDGTTNGDAVHTDAPPDGPASCTPPQTYCANDGGACVDKTSDPNHCGACTTVCTTADSGALVPGSNDNPDAGIPPTDAGTDSGPPWSLGTTSCAKSTCGIDCPSSMTLCTDDICYDTNVFHEHCGDCNTACASTEYCTTGHCCATGTAYCGSSCIDVLTDSNNCGSCGNACAGSALCSGGQCVKCGGTNEALTATATISGGGSVSPYLPSEANDGVVETTSCSGFAWITAGTSPGTAWIQYAWSSAHTMVSMHMDTVSATVPDSCSTYTASRTLGGAEVQYWNGSSWVTDGTVSGEKDDWDYTFTSAVSTTKVRLYAVYSTGTNSNPLIFEWQVKGCN